MRLHIWLPMATSSFEYYAREFTQITMERTGKIEYMAEAKVANEKEFDTLIENLGITVNCIGTSNKPMPILARPKHELTGNDKVKVDWC